MQFKALPTSPQVGQDRSYPQFSEAQIKGNLKYEQITYKIKDGFYLATSIQAFRDEEFVLLNWIQHIVVFQNSNAPFDSSLKQLYGQQGDQIIEEGQQVIRYLHCSQNLFDCPQQQQKYLQTTNDQNHQYKRSPSHQQQSNQTPQTQQSFIKQIQHGKHQNTGHLADCFQKIYQFIQSSSQLGSSCLILISSSTVNMHDLGSGFSICSAYLMKKYKWSLFKTLQFMSSRIKEVSIHQKAYDFLNQLQIQLLNHENLTYDWKHYQSGCQLVLRNTFLNCSKKQHKIRGFNQFQHNIQSERATSQLKRKHKSEKVFKDQGKSHEKNQQENDGNQTCQKIILCTNRLRPILASRNQTKQRKASISLKRMRVQINLGFNSTKEYQIQQSHQFIPDKIHQNLQFTQDNLQFTQDKIYHAANQLRADSKLQNWQQGMISQQKSNIKGGRFSDNFLTTSRKRQISLSVSQIVSKYRQQGQKKQLKTRLQLKNKKSLCFDDFYQMNLKSMSKKQSYYNFHTSQSQKTTKRTDYDVEINKIIKKIKQKQKQQQKQKLSCHELSIAQTQKQTLLTQRFLPKQRFLYERQKENSLLLDLQKQEIQKRDGNNLIKPNKNEDNSFMQSQVFISKRQNQNWTKTVLTDHKQSNRQGEIKPTKQSEAKRQLHFIFQSQNFESNHKISQKNIQKDSSSKKQRPHHFIKEVRLKQQNSFKKDFELHAFKQNVDLAQTNNNRLYEGKMKDAQENTAITTSKQSMIHFSKGSSDLYPVLNKIKKDASQKSLSRQKRIEDRKQSFKLRQESLSKSKQSNSKNMSKWR